MRHKEHDVDFCVIGGGLAGLCAAIAAARRGIRTAIMQDRPVFGGNASSEIRMWVCGAHGDNLRETGLLEEFILENYYRNPNLSFSIWDSVLYGKAIAEKNLKIFLNCTCTGAEMEGNRIQSVQGWQLTSETTHTIRAKFFADCSGDSILAPLTGAEYRMGRESKREFGETIPPDEADRCTMGMSCLIQARETDSPKSFIPPEWAYSFPTDEALSHRGHGLQENFWWIELGGDQDSIHDTEELRDELLKIAFGVWDHVKNYGDHGYENWELDWVGFLPGKRESRRYVGDHIVTQKDVEAAGKFDDVIAYAGWTMDDHFPQGFHYRDGHPTIYHPAPSPWGIPYRSIYSRNISNLLFAGRNISVTHAALSSSRVMGTCALLGQAAGNAAALAVEQGCGLREVPVSVLQQRLMEEDCFLPGMTRESSLLTKKAKVSHPVVTDGWDRPWKEDYHGFTGTQGDKIEFRLEQPEFVSGLRLVFDSNLNRKVHNMPCQFPLKQKGFEVPETLMKRYRIEWICEDGSLEQLEIDNNHRRLSLHPIGKKVSRVSWIPLESWGDAQFRLFSMDLLE